MKIFITGSTTGLGLLAGQMLLKEGHDVVLHARNKNSSMKEKVPYVLGDLTKIDEVKKVAEQANALGPFDGVIHNAGVYTSGPEELFAVNVVAPYVLCCLMTPPKRMVFMSSGMHLSGRMNLDPHSCSYSDTKLFDLIFAKHLAKIWPQSFVNAVDPGWVPTRMGGAGAPDDLMKGAETQAWLSVGQDVSGKYFHHKKQHPSNPLADDPKNQEKLVTFLEEITGLRLPENL